MLPLRQSAGPMYQDGLVGILVQAGDRELVEDSKVAESIWVGSSDRASLDRDPQQPPVKCLCGFGSNMNADPFRGSLHAHHLTGSYSS